MENVLPDSKLRIRNMAERVVTVIESNPDIVASVPILNEIVLELNSYIEHIGQDCGDRFVAKNESSGEMMEEKRKAAHKIVVMAKLLLGYGKRNKIQELETLCDISESNLMKTPYGEVVDKAQTILGLAKKYLLAMSAYAITQEDITFLENIINEYADTLEATGEEQTEGVSLTEELDAEFTKLMESLYSLDDIVDGLEEKYPKFHLRYKKARKIYHYGIRHLKLEERLTRREALINKKKNKKDKTKKSGENETAEQPESTPLLQEKIQKDEILTPAVKTVTANNGESTIKEELEEKVNTPEFVD